MWRPMPCWPGSDVRAMRWHAYKLKDGRAAQNTIASSEGYAVLRCTANSVPTGRFISFLVRLDSRLVLGGYDSADEAKAACEHHHAQRVEAAA